MRALCTITGCLFVLAGGVAAAQDQTVIIDQPLKACTVPAETLLSSATLTESQAASVIRAALNIADPDPQNVLHRPRDGIHARTYDDRGGAVVRLSHGLGQPDDAEMVF